MAKLLVTLPGVGDVLHEVENGEALIGRTSDNSVQIDHRSVALHHARLTWAEGVFTLHDLTSGNRTWVNGVPIFEVALTETSLVRFGEIPGIFLPVAEGEFWANVQLLRGRLATLAQDRDALVEQLQPLQTENAHLLGAHGELEDRLREFAQQRSGYEHTNEQLSRQLVELRHEMSARETTGDTERSERLQRDLRVALAKIIALEAAMAERGARLSAAEAEREEARAASETLSAALVAIHHDAQGMGRQWEELLRGLESAKRAGAGLFALANGAGLVPTSRPDGEEPDAATTVPPAISTHAKTAPIVPVPLAELPHYSVRTSIDAMRAAASRLRANRHDRMALNELFSGARALAQPTNATESLGAMRCMASTLEALLGDLCKLPELLDAPRFRTILRAIDTLQSLVGRDPFAATQDLVRATICVVSDDAEEPMIEATRLVDFDLSTINYPTERLEAVAELDCALIILDQGRRDTNPAMTCERVREFARHRQTPVILVASPADGDEETPVWSAEGCDDVLMKPFNAYEMAARILLGIFEHRLARRPAAGE